MIEISEQVYLEKFQAIFDWFQSHIHADPDSYRYEIVDLKRTHIKMIELVNKRTGNTHFRVLIKATYDPIDETFLPKENLKEVGYLQQSQTNNPLIPGTAFQVCYIRLNNLDQPIDEILYTYSPDDRKYHVIKRNG